MALGLARPLGGKINLHDGADLASQPLMELKAPRLLGSHLFMSSSLVVPVLVKYSELGKTLPAQSIRATWDNVAI